MNLRAFVGVGLSVVCATAATAQVTLGFEVDDGGSPLVNGQDINTPPEFGNLVNVSSTGGLGAAIFDSDPTGPNAGGADDDLLVDLGNILIIQNNAFPTQTTPGIFDTPNDEENGGTLVFSFINAVMPLSIDVVDINGNGPADAILTDSNGLTRTFNMPMNWTFDIASSGPDGYETLDLTTLAPQLGEGGASATAFEDAGFDINSVVELEVIFTGSAGIDNLSFIPEPSSLLLLSLGLVALRRR